MSMLSLPFHPTLSKPPLGENGSNRFASVRHLFSPQNPRPNHPHSPLSSKASLHQDSLLLHEWPSLLQISIGSGDFHLGSAIHAFLKKSDSQQDIFTGNNLINMYSKFDELEKARQVFDEMPIKNAITWTTLINGYSQVDESDSVFRVSSEMHRSGEKFNCHTCTAVLQACGFSRDQNRGEQVHALVIKSGFEMDLFVGTSLVSMYAKTEAMDYAEMVFECLVNVDVRCLNSMILGYSKIDDGNKAIRTFRKLLESDLEPNDYTLTNIISSCICLNAARMVHGLAVKYGGLCGVAVDNAIITMYGKHGLVEEAERMFCKISEKNLISWTAILSVYVKNRHFKKAASGFVKMLNLGICFDSSCLATVIDGCSNSKDLAFGFQIHSLVIKLGYMSDIFVATGLINTYVTCGDMKSARQTFNLISDQCTASFNAILGGFSGAYEDEEDFMAFFDRKRLNGMKPDSLTFAGLISLSADQTSIAKGKCLHAYIIKTGFDKYITVGNAVITMYAKCGCIDDSSRKFSNMIDRDSVTWNAIVSAFALHGQGKQSLAYFEKMKTQGFLPDEFTLVSVLQACSYSGLYEEGSCLYHSMERRYGIKPRIEHHACFVDLLARAGHVSEALELVKKSQHESSPLLWRTLVNACKLNRNLYFGELASNRLLELVSDDAASYILVSNLYSSIGMLQESAKVRVMMKDRKMRKEVGCSWIEVNNKVHRFVASGKDHPESTEIYRKLDELKDVMRAEGHVPIV